MALTRDQQTEYDRLAADRQERLVVPLDQEGKPDLTAELVPAPGTVTLAKMERLSVPSLRARVNILGMKGGVPKWAPENNYSDEEKADIEAANIVSNWDTAVPQLLADVVTFRARGMADDVVRVILRQGRP